MAPRKIPEKWQKEKDVLKKVQLHFSFKDDVMRKLRYEAADDKINPSDIVRKIVGLTYRKIQRPRIGLSFDSDELKLLAERYGMDSPDEKTIQQKVLDEVDLYYRK